MNGLIVGYFLVELIRILYRAVLDTGCTTGALLFDDVSGFLDQRDLEVSRLPFYSVNFGKCQNFDVRMPADLDQFG